MAFAQKIIGDKFNRETAVVLYVRGTTADGQPLYAYTALRPSEWSSFQEAVRRKQDVTLEQYGVVLHSGLGEPSPALKAEMKEKYGVDS